MDVETERNVDRLWREQGGHATRRQLVRAGMSRQTVDRRRANGLLVPVGLHTFRTAAVPRSHRGDVVAACLEMDGTASHWTAAWLHGLTGCGDRVDVTVRRSATMYEPPLRWPEQPAVRVHSSTNLPAVDVIDVDRIPTTTVARTALGLAALVPGELSVGRLHELVGKMVDEKLATDPWLWWLLAQRRCRGRNGVRALEDVLAARALLGPTESWLERELARLVEAAGLPVARTQRRIRHRGRFVARVDFVYDDERVVVEALGYAHHRTKEQLEADTRRANELQLLGYVVLQFSFEQIVSSPATVIATIRQALAQARGRLAA